MSAIQSGRFLQLIIAALSYLTLKSCGALQCKNDGVPVSVYLSASEEPYDQQLQQAANDYQQKTGKRLAVLLVTNPDNPTGTVYTKDRLLQMLTWCVKNKVHLIRYSIYSQSALPQHQTST